MENKKPIEAFPLQWPEGFERAKSKKYSQFQCTVAQARDGVLNEISRLNGKNVIISTNVPVKQNGDMYASQKPVDGDHGVAVYFTWKNDQYVLACDNYYQIWENLRAIQKTIEALRGIERWGASDLLTRAFKGFKQLGSASGIATQNWWDILEVSSGAHAEVIKSKYRELVKTYHPDVPKTGDTETFKKIQKAYEQSCAK